MNSKGLTNLRMYTLIGPEHKPLLGQPFLETIMLDYNERLFGQTSTISVSTTEHISCGRAAASLLMYFPQLPTIVLECLKPFHHFVLYAHLAHYVYYFIETEQVS